METLSTSLDWFQTASSIKACSDSMFNESMTIAFSGVNKDERQASGNRFLGGYRLRKRLGFLMGIGPRQ